MVANFTKVMGHDASTSDDAGSALSRLEFFDHWEKCSNEIQVDRFLGGSSPGFSRYKGNIFFTAQSNSRRRADKHVTLLLVDHVPIVRSVLISTLFVTRKD